MSGRAVVFAAIASIVVVLIGAVVASTALIVVGLTSSVVAGMLLAIKTDDTTQPMGQLLFDKPRV